MGELAKEFLGAGAAIVAIGALYHRITGTLDRLISAVSDLTVKVAKIETELGV